MWEKIENIRDLSVEHREPWQSAENPKESFFDLDNIEFSHLNCNILAGDRSGRRNSKGETGFKGVTFLKNRNLKKPYGAKIVENHKTIHLGYFETPEKASEVYEKALKK